MIFSKTPIGGESGWKFIGRCQDSGGEVWYFYTQHKIQYLRFRDKGTFGGMKFMEGEDQSAKYKTVKKLEGEE